MALHPLAQQFASVADEYELGRPEYPPAAIGALAAELGLATGAPVLDLGAGTGKLSRALLAAGFDVIAVEPLAPMRELLVGHLGAERVRAGTAESIPLPDEAVAAVTAGDAFHWFDRAAALPEIRRVLRPRGGLAILTTVTDWGGASWADEVGRLVVESRPTHPHFDGPAWQEVLRADRGWGEPREVRVTTFGPAVPERIVAHLSSMSWVAGMPEQERAEFAGRLQSLIVGGHTPDVLPAHVVIGLAQLEPAGER